MYFSAPLVALIMQRYPGTRRPGMFIGALIVVVALLAASFCNSVAGLLATQGVLYAVGGLLLYYPAMIYVDEWFVKRKGLAYGVMWAGSGSAGVVVPFLLQWLLDTYGFRTALRVWTIILVSSPLRIAFVLIHRLTWGWFGRRSASHPVSSGSKVAYPLQLPTAVDPSISAL